MGRRCLPGACNCILVKERESKSMEELEVLYLSVFLSLDTLPQLSIRLDRGICRNG